MSTTSASISKENLKQEIIAILRNVDLTTTSSKKVRTDLEQKLNCDLVARKKEIAAVIEQYVAENVKDEESESSSESEEEEVKPKPAPAAATKRSKSAASKRSAKRSDDDSASPDDDSDSEPTPAKKKRAAGKKSAAANGDGAKKKANSFTRPVRLSAELAHLMGEPELPRHEVVKRMWGLIKGRNLYDPNNKQFAICDDDLMAVIGVKRFRTFGMLKYLKRHFDVPE